MVEDWHWHGYSSRSFEADFSLFSWKSWGIIIIGVLAVDSFIMALLLSYKLRILTASLSAISLGSRVHGLPTELNFFTPTAIPYNNTNVFQFFSLPTDLTLDISVILLLVLIVLVVLVKGFRRQQKSRYQFDLFLVLGIDTSACQIWVKSFKLDPACYCFSASTYIESLEVKGCIRPRLVISWSTLRIQSGVTNESYSLPSSVGLNWKQARYIRKVLRKAYWCVLVTKTQAGYSLLSLPYRDWNSAPAYGEINRAFSMVTLKQNFSAPAL